MGTGVRRRVFDVVVRRSVNSMVRILTLPRLSPLADDPVAKEFDEICHPRSR